jgi:hypothetical protein
LRRASGDTSPTTGTADYSLPNARGPELLQTLGETRQTLPAIGNTSIEAATS